MNADLMVVLKLWLFFLLISLGVFLLVTFLEFLFDLIERKGLMTGRNAFFFFLVASFLAALVVGIFAEDLR